jgi:hypothetical protein
VEAIRILANWGDAKVGVRITSRIRPSAVTASCELYGFLVESAAGRAFAKEIGRKVYGAWSAKQGGACEAPGKEVLTSNTPNGIAAAAGV